jgi:hypothetical protein
MAKQSRKRLLQRVLVSKANSVAQLLALVERDTRDWEQYGNARPWFRGQADAAEPLLPSVLRSEFDQVRMMLTFRNRASAFAPTPPRTELAEWLFLAQHYGLPTRLLDWTESPLLACLFALEETLYRRRPTRYKSADIGVWLIHPIELNAASMNLRDFPNTFSESPVLENFRFAFGTAGERFPPTELPVAIQTRLLDIRMAGQQSCFTVHGQNRSDFERLFANTDVARRGYFRKYVIPRAHAPKLLAELDRLGVSFSTVYPDLNGLAMQLRLRFMGKPATPVIPPVPRTDRGKKQGAGSRNRGQAPELKRGHREGQGKGRNSKAGQPPPDALRSLHEPARGIR